MADGRSFGKVLTKLFHINEWHFQLGLENVRLCKHLELLVESGSEQTFTDILTRYHAQGEHHTKRKDSYADTN